MDNQSFQEQNPQTAFEQEQLHKKRLCRKRKKLLVRVIIIVILLFASLVCYNSLSSVKPDGSSVVIDIEAGQNAKQIAKLLKDNGLIKSSRLFLFDLKRSEYGSSLRYGVYKIDKGTSHEDIILLLAKGGDLKNGVTVTIPEGYSAERIKALLVEKGLVTDEEFEEALKLSNYEFLKTVPDDNRIKYPLQGFLFPATYQFSYDMTATEMVDMMLQEFKEQIGILDISYDKLYETITLASLVEREAKIPSERATIAGVIKNRIEKGMRLQIDATVVYAVSDGLYNVDRVFYRDLEVDSPYNTYMYSGLPIGPICSPGIESIKAAVSPEAHSFYYYRTDNEKADGSHIFTENFDEHKDAAN